MQVALPRKGDRVRATDEEDEDMAEDDEAEEAADEGLAPHACSLALLTIFVFVSFSSGVPGTLKQCFWKIFGPMGAGPTYPVRRLPRLRHKRLSCGGMLTVFKMAKLTYLLEASDSDVRLKRGTGPKKGRCLTILFCPVEQLHSLSMH